MRFHSVDADSKFALFLGTFIDEINACTPFVKLSGRKAKLAFNPG